MQSDNPMRVKGWILDVYPSGFGEIAVWIISESGDRIRLTDRFEPKIYVSGREEDLERLASRFFAYNSISSWDFAYKFARTTDTEKSKVLEVTLRDCRKIPPFVHDVLELGRYQKFQLYNCDLRGDHAYLLNHDIFPLALVEVESSNCGELKYNLLDSTESVDYRVPSLRVARVSVEVAKTGKIVTLNDPIDKITVTQTSEQYG